MLRTAIHRVLHRHQKRLCARVAQSAVPSGRRAVIVGVVMPVTRQNRLSLRGEYNAIRPKSETSSSSAVWPDMRPTGKPLISTVHGMSHTSHGGMRFSVHPAITCNAAAATTAVNAVARWRAIRCSEKNCRKASARPASRRASAVLRAIRITAPNAVHLSRVTNCSPRLARAMPQTNTEHAHSARRLKRRRGGGDAGKTRGATGMNGTSAGSRGAGDNADATFEGANGRETARAIQSTQADWSRLSAKHSVEPRRYLLGCGASDSARPS